MSGLPRSLLSCFSVESLVLPLKVNWVCWQPFPEDPFGNSSVASMTRAIATQMGSHRVAIYTTPAPELRIDGQLHRLTPGGYLLLALAERPPQDPEDEDSERRRVRLAPQGFGLRGESECLLV